MLYGGYSRVKATVAVSKSTKAGPQWQKNIRKPMIHQDCFFLRISQPPPESPANTPPKVRWEKRKRPANAPVLCGATMAYHKNRGILFGGVHDVEESDEGIESEFFNGLYAWNIDRNRFFSLALRKLRGAKEDRGVGAAVW